MHVLAWSALPLSSTNLTGLAPTLRLQKAGCGIPGLQLRVAQVLNSKFPLGMVPGHSPMICRNFSPLLTHPSGEVSIWEMPATKYETQRQPWAFPCMENCPSLFIRDAKLTFSQRCLFPSPGQGTVWLELFVSLTFFTQLCPAVSLSFYPPVTLLMNIFCGVSSLYNKGYYYYY